MVQVPLIAVLHDGNVTVLKEDNYPRNSTYLLNSFNPIFEFQFRQGSKLPLENIKQILIGEVKSYRNNSDALDSAYVFRNISFNEDTVLELENDGFSYMVIEAQFANNVSGIYALGFENTPNDSNEIGYRQSLQQKYKQDGLRVLNPSSIKFNSDDSFRSVAESIMCHITSGYGFQVCKTTPKISVQNYSKGQESENSSSTVSTSHNTIDYQSPDLGLKFMYPSSWTAPIIPDYKNCFKNSDSCNVSFPLGYKTPNNTIENFIVGVRVNDLTMTGSSVSTDSFSTLNNTCSCSTLEDYIKWDYNRLFKENDVTADNRTTLGKNYSAWQMEVFNKDNGYKTFVTWAINDNLGYRFIYSAPANNHYDYYLNEYKDLLDSVTFTKVEVTEPVEVTERTVPKKPSFLSDAKIAESPIASSALNGTVNNTSTPNGTVNNTNPSNVPSKSDSTDTTQSNASQVKEAFKTYENPGFGLTLTHPPTWSVEELRSDPTESSDNSIVAIFKSQSQGENDMYLENVIINVQGPRSDIKSLEAYTRDSTQAFKNMSDTIKITKQGKDTLAGFPAHRIEYTSTGIPGLDLKKMQVFTVLDNVAYVVTYGAEQDEYDKNHCKRERN